MDDLGSYRGTIDPETGRRRCVAFPADGPIYEVGEGVAWGWEGEATRALASSLLLDLTGVLPLGEMAWDLCAEIVDGWDSGTEWTLAAADLAAWRRDWLRRPARRGLLERVLAGSLLRTPTHVDPELLRGRRERLVAEHAARVAGRGEDRVDLEEVGLLVAALGLGDDPRIVERWHDAAPDRPGPHFWAAQLAALKP